MTLKFGMQHWVLKYYQVCSNDDPGLTLTYFYGKVKFGPLYFCMGKGKTMDFSETIVVYDSKLATDEEVSVDIKTLSPGALCPLPRGYIHVLNNKNKCINQTSKRFFFKLATNG